MPRLFVERCITKVNVDTLYTANMAEVIVVDRMTSLLSHVLSPVTIESEPAVVEK